MMTPQQLRSERKLYYLLVLTKKPMLHNPPREKPEHMALIPTLFFTTQIGTVTDVRFGLGSIAYKPQTTQNLNDSLNLTSHH